MSDIATNWADLQARLARYIAAETKILQSQEYQFGQGGSSRRNRHADLAEVRAEIASMNAQALIHPGNPLRARRRIRYIRAI